MEAPRKHNKQSFYLQLSSQFFKKGDTMISPNGIELLVLKTYKSRWWRFLRWLGFKVKSSGTVKVKYK